VSYWPWAALLTLAGCASELIGVLFLADDLAEKGPEAWMKWAQRKIRPLAAKIGLDIRTEHASLGGAIGGHGHVTADLTFIRSVDRSLQQKVTDLETDTKALFDRTAGQQKELRALQGTVAALPEHLKAEAERIAEAQIKHQREKQYPIQRKSFLFVLAGVVLNGLGAIFALA
jgi:hypothetical protein